LKSAINALAAANVDKVEYNIVAICQIAKPEYITEGCSQLTILHDIIFENGKSQQNAVHFALGVARIREHLQSSGLSRPDIVIIQSGFGLEIMCERLFPDIPIIGYFEWYDSSPNGITNPNVMMFNTITTDFADRCSALIIPTQYQKMQFPISIRRKMMVIHEGIDTEFFGPLMKPRSQFVITYISRGLESMRCILQFVTIMKMVMTENPNVIVQIIGEDKTFYETVLPDMPSYKQQSLDILAGDPQISKRVNWLGVVSKEGVREVLQSSDLHIYFAKPQGVSWSLLEAMACECLIMASDIEVLNEVTKPSGERCLLVDHDDLQGCKETVLSVIENHDKYQPMRKNARQFVVDKYNSKSGGKAWKTIIDTLL
jgi:glycosyltransferase involved in cell wall biosynthesis